MNTLKFFILFIISVFLNSCLVSNPVPEDYEIFKGTPVWDLAKAVKNNNSEEIVKLVSENGIDINYQEPRYGFTVLMTAVSRSRTPFYKIKPETIETLLMLGADPNIYADKEGQWGSNAVLNSCDDNYYDGLSLLLKYGGDSNSRYRRAWGTFKTDATALMCIANSNINRKDNRGLELLLLNGAEVNAKSESFNGGALEAASFDMNKALIILKNGADPNTLIYRTDLEEPITFAESLRYYSFPLDSENYHYKLDVINFLKDKGIDYYSYPIPPNKLKHIKERYPDNWEEYIKVY